MRTAGHSFSVDTCLQWLWHSLHHIRARIGTVPLSPSITMWVSLGWTPRLTAPWGGRYRLQSSGLSLSQTSLCCSLPSLCYLNPLQYRTLQTRHLPPMMDGQWWMGMSDHSYFTTLLPPRHPLQLQCPQGEERNIIEGHFYHIPGKTGMAMWGSTFQKVGGPWPQKTSPETDKFLWFSRINFMTIKTETSLCAFNSL